MWIFIWIKRRLKPLPFTEIKTLIIDWRDSNVSRHFYYLCYSKFCSGFPSSGLHQIWILSADMSVSLTTLNKTFSLMLFYCFLFLLWIAVEFCEYFFFFFPGTELQLEDAKKWKTKTIYGPVYDIRNFSSFKICQ